MDLDRYFSWWNGSGAGCWQLDLMTSQSDWVVHLTNSESTIHIGAPATNFCHMQLFYWLKFCKSWWLTSADTLECDENVCGRQKELSIVRHRERRYDTMYCKITQSFYSRRPRLHLMWNIPLLKMVSRRQKGKRGWQMVANGGLHQDFTFDSTLCCWQNCATKRHSYSKKKKTMIKQIKTAFHTVLFGAEYRSFYTLSISLTIWT